jgi:hypothetical protein
MSFFSLSAFVSGALPLAGLRAGFRLLGVAAIT